MTDGQARRARGWMCAALAIAAGCLTPGAAAAATGGWAVSWAAGAQAPASGDPLAVAGLDGQTVRDIVLTSGGGSQVRIRVSNAFSSTPLTVGDASVAVEAAGAALVPGSSHPLTFAGKRSVTIPAGGQALSDPTPMTVPAMTDLAVSLYLPAATGPVTFHRTAHQLSYISTAGDDAAQELGTAFTSTTQSWYYLDAVDVLGAATGRNTVVAFGDSITDGGRVVTNTNTRWPNDLARRLQAAGSPLDVADEGISGNRLLSDSACFGASGLARLDRDVLTQPGVRYLILLEGINDIDYSEAPDSGCYAPNTSVSAAQLELADRQIVTAAHAKGIKVIGATLTPNRGYARASDTTEAKREALNDWILHGGAFDGTIDFAAAVADPLDPRYLAAPDDSGDHLHPNAAGYQAMADAIPLTLLR